MDLERMRTLMKEQGLDGIVAASPTNVLYSSGAYIMTQRFFRDRLALAVFTPDRDPVLLVCNIEESLARSESYIADVRSYVEFREHPIDVLASILVELGLQGKTIGVELNYLTHRQGDRLLRALPGTRFEPAEPVFSRLRMVKTPDEIDRLRRAAAGTHRAIERVLSSAGIGQSEKSIADAITVEILREGASEPAFIVLSAGERTVQAHPIAGSRPLASGDVIRLDAGGFHAGYYSDEAYTAVVGDVSAHRLSMFRRTREVHREVIRNARSGVRACDLFDLCSRLSAEAGLPFRAPHIGHSLGLELHELPMISPMDQTVLAAGMVINLEPIFVDTADGAGYHHEDLVLIREGEPEVLTGSDLRTEPLVIR